MLTSQQNPTLLAAVCSASRAPRTRARFFSVSIFFAPDLLGGISVECCKQTVRQFMRYGHKKCALCYRLPIAAALFWIEFGNIMSALLTCSRLNSAKTASQLPKYHCIYYPVSISQISTLTLWIFLIGNCTVHHSFRNTKVAVNRGKKY